MRVDIIQGKGNKPLRRICHEGEVYVKAPKQGSYRIQLYNHTDRRRLAVVTVDGVNVLSGKDGDFKGQGYVLRPGETVEIPGWRRDEGAAAAFLFRQEEQSYANQTGRGIRNVGVVGVAVFDEEPPILIRCPNTHLHHHHHHHHPDLLFSTDTTDNTGHSRSGTGTSCSSSGRKRLSKPHRPSSVQPRGVEFYDTEPTTDVGTGYGREVEFQTTSTVFTRATEEPAEVVVLRYAVKERLQSWGVPVHKMKRPNRKPSPQAFPISQSPSVPPPPGWVG